MRQKCPICNSCLKIFWRKNRRFFFCDFCNKSFDLVNLHYAEIKGFIENLDGTVKVIYKEKDD